MTVALSPMGLDLVWMILSPAVLILFSCVWGLFINLKVPIFNWENETYVVKQSMSAAVGGICSALVGVILIFALLVVPSGASRLLKAGSMVALVTVTFVIYNKNNKVRLEEL